MKTDPHKRVETGGEVEEGQLVRGYVKAISARGCFIALSRVVDGFVGLKHLSDEYIKADQLSELLPIGTLVVARVLLLRHSVAVRAEDAASSAPGRTTARPPAMAAARAA